MQNVAKYKSEILDVYRSLVLRQVNELGFR